MKTALAGMVKALAGAAMALAGTAMASALSGSPLEAWNRYEKQVRDQSLPKDTLIARVPAVYASIRGLAAEPSRDTGFLWGIPVAGASLRDVGKGGFRPGIRYGGSKVKGYDFFDGNLHGGHPAYDIFIRDKDRNAKDDGTDLPVEVLAPEDMILISKEDSWTPGSDMRGGKYAWALIPRADMLIYFAHLDTIYANPGDRVTAGKSFGRVGRTGKNAWAARSPTHLHFMVLRVAGGALRPVDYFPFFRK